MRKFNITLLAAALCCMAANAQKSPESALQQSIRTVQEVLVKLQANYVDSLKIEKNVHDGLEYMLQSLDPYTEYYNSDETDQFINNNQGEYGGIGITLATYNGQTFFSSPMEGHPAFKAGFRTGDKVIKVDSVDTRGRDSNFVTKLVRGQAGTPVTITVVRPFVQDSIITATLIRSKVAIPAVSYYEILPSGIGYIHLSSFSPDNTAEQVRRVLEEFKRDKKLKGIILDLSDNGGGLLNQAVEIASMFLPRGSKVLETKGRTADKSTVYTTRREPIFPSMPMAVIINRGSASASEVLAGALQDYDRAVLVGERSFGKGLVQSTMPLPYNAMLKLTTAKYYIPSGRLIQALDYSNRDENGHPGYTPDSLANTFFTAAGRPVKDGGGLQPEVIVKDTMVNYYLMYNLVRNPYLFNFANRWYAEHPMKEGTPFVMTDEVWNAFASSLPKEALDYETSTSQALDALRKAAGEDKLLTPAIAEQLDKLTQELKPESSTLLKESRADIEAILAPMIAERYGFQKAAKALETTVDPTVIQAEKILLSPRRYKELLSRPAR